MSAGRAPRRRSSTRPRKPLVVLHSEVAQPRQPSAAGPSGVRSAAAPIRKLMDSAVKRTQSQAPVMALEGLGQLSLALRRLTGRDVIDLGAMLEVAQFVYRQQELRRRGADYEVDEFGFDQEWTESLLPIFRWIFHNYWRVETSGIENVPAHGRALLVSNHAGVLPWDGAMIKTAILEQHPNPRHARALIATFFFGLPVMSWFLRRTGQTVGHPDDTMRLLEKDQLVLVFPEGVKGTGKPFKDRYRLRRFGRGGFVQAAIRAKAPLVPISVVGSEEIYPMLADLGMIAKPLGFPYLPVTATWPALGPLGLVPLPSNWRIQFHPPIRTDLLDESSALDQNLVMTLSDQVRDTIQQGIYENLRRRRRTFF